MAEEGADGGGGREDPHYRGHRQRLRGRLRENPGALRDYELLELMLGHVLTRKDTKPLAKELLRRFHSLRGALQASEAELLAVEGFGPALADYWLLWREFTARYAESPLRRRELLASPEAVAVMAGERLSGQAYESVWAAFVDAQNRLLAWEETQKGDVSAASIRPRDILERALLLKASGFILAHNHPGGRAVPSRADLEMTRRLKKAAQALNIRFLDHIIIADGEPYSLLRAGEL
ncbi:MAG: DNA repair protein RadC [Deltaproteobacteria bacterium]|jgi:DNA repair protein RadC|nr:DNA repair protein RadC [Deltaproteobacteria bacterium]